MASLTPTNRPPDRSVEVEYKPPQVGFPLSTLSKDLFVELMHLYADSVGANKDELTENELDREYSRATHELGKRDGYEWRLGSRLTTHSKFKITTYGGKERIDLCYVYCHANVSTPNSASRDMQNTFHEACDNFLRSKGVAVERPIYG